MISFVHWPSNAMDCSLLSGMGDNIDPALVHHRMIAGNSIGRDTLSRPFFFDTVRLVSILYSTHQQQQSSSLKPRNYTVNCANGLLQCDNDSDAWMHRVRLALNCFEQNLAAFAAEPLSSTASSSSRIRIVFKTIRPIVPGEELCFWPSFDLHLMLNLPFLIPANIISGSCFLCTKCGKFFSQPNPLKVHIKFACFDALQESTSFHLQAAAQRLWNPIVSETAISPIQNPTPRPAKLLDIERISRKTFVTSENHSSTPKRLHHCTYCGKVYTRKYGLKIHIRTHTGLKPLSCRFCARSFSDPSNLNKHVRLHTQPK